MPKIIKSDAVIEEKDLFVVDLPVISVNGEKNEASLRDDFDFFQATESVADDDGCEAFFALTEQDGDNSYLKYFTNLTEFLPSDKELACFDMEQEPDKDDESCDNDTSLTGLNDDQEPPYANFEQLEENYFVTLKQQEEQIIAQAQERASKIVAEAKKEAENLRLKLVAEISEAEVKKELAKSMAQSTLDESQSEADKIIETANEAAREIKEKAKSEAHAEGLQQGTEQGYKEGVEKGLEEGRRSGHSAGHKEGFAAGEEKGRAEGYKKAYEEMAKQISASTQKSKDILLEAQKEKEKIIKSSDSQIIEIAMAVVEKILHKEFSENPFSILPVIKEAINKVADQPRIFITVSTDNYELVNSTLGEIKKALGGKQEMSVVADTTLTAGDVIVGTGGSGDVDARLETQMSQIRKTIEMVMHQ